MLGKRIGVNIVIVTATVKKIVVIAIARIVNVNNLNLKVLSLTTLENVSRVNE